LRGLQRAREVIEERGGLGAQVKQLAWETKASCRLQTFHLQDAFLHAYGTYDDVRRAHGLSVGQILPVIGKSYGEN